ncbi:hypothetical protein [Exiguobacterium sp. JLM-2]|uniref:hypothetical protein n=1 Tax=Exiguobacterium sp. JLM-2 TaxID=1647415 RepID=UPI0006498EDD|nr:hypothetical protein [Exiguobacterium sp. JLM-2]
MSDENKMIKKLEEHRDLKNLVIDIGKLNDICVKETEGNDEKGDFYYPLDKEKQLINCIDEYLGHRKYVRKEDE